MTEEEMVQVFKSSLWIIACLVVIIIVFTLARWKMDRDKRGLEQLSQESMKDKCEMIAATKLAEREQKLKNAAKKNKEPRMYPSAADDGFIEGESLVEDLE